MKALPSAPDMFTSVIAAVQSDTIRPAVPIFGYACRSHRYGNEQAPRKICVAPLTEPGNILHLSGDKLSRGM